MHELYLAVVRTYALPLFEIRVRTFTPLLLFTLAKASIYWVDAGAAKSSLFQNIGHSTVR
jgi:hypothetical protein